MKIRHERPMPELALKVRAPLQLELQDGETVLVNEWSLAGFTFPRETDVLPKKGFLTIPFQGIDIRFPVAFIKGQGPLDLEFKNLTGRQREVIAVFYRSILSGKMAASADVITSLDTPLDLVPMGETETEEAEGKANSKPRSLRIVWNLVFYVVLAITLVGVIGGQIWDRLSSVGLHNARVVAPITIQHTVTAAYVDSILVRPGDEVSRGQTLLRLSDPALESEIDDIRRDVARAKTRVKDARSLLTAHLGNEADVRAILVGNYQKALSPLKIDNFLGDRDLTVVTQAYLALKQFDARAREKQGDFHDIRIQLGAQLSDAKEIERRLKRDLANAKAAARSVDIVAQSDGRVKEILVFESEFLPRGKAVVHLEGDSQRVIMAWADEARAGTLFVGMTAEVILRNQGGKQTYAGVISDISGGIDPTTDNRFGMIVSVTLPELDVPTAREVLRDGAPVKVRALKEWRVLGWLS